MTFNYEIENGLVLVEITVPLQNRSGVVVPRIHIATAEVIMMLLNENIEISEVIQSAQLSNAREATRSREWIFKIKEDKELDKSPESVILEVDKKETPSKTKAKRKSRKKKTEA